MKKMILATLLGLAATGAMAKGHHDHNHGPQQFSGGFVNSQQEVSKVADLANMQDDQFVVLQGQIVKQVNKKDYLFKDASGEVQVEIDRRAWNGVDIAPTDEVKLYGEVDKGLNKLEVEVDRVEKVAK